MKTIWIKKLDNYYWQAGFTNENRTHTFPKHGPGETFRNIEILLNHGYEIEDSNLFEKLKQERVLLYGNIYSSR